MRATHGVRFTKASLGHKLSPVRYEDYVHDSGRVFQRPKARAPFVCATFASIASTCPDDCPLKGKGCYAQNGFHAPAMKLLDAAGMGGMEVIEEEVRLIDSAFAPPTGARIWRPGDPVGRVPQDGARGGRDLRLHVSGDVPTDGAREAAQLLAGAAVRWAERDGGRVWAYTHQWHRAPRSAWGGISVLASCDRPYEVSMAKKQGYATALVVGSFPRVADARSDRAYELTGVLGKVVPCPAQTRRDVTCADCRLCLNPGLASLGITIAFAAHGNHPARAPRKNKPRSLPVLA